MIMFWMGERNLSLPIFVIVSYYLNYKIMLEYLLHWDLVKLDDKIDCIIFTFDYMIAY
jgi:hypothetical protein